MSDETVCGLVLLTVQLAAVTLLRMEGPAKRHLTYIQPCAVNPVVNTCAVVRDDNRFVFACLGQKATTQTDVSHKLPNTHGVLSLL